MRSDTAQLSAMRWLAVRGGLLGTLGCLCRLVYPRSPNICFCFSAGSDGIRTASYVARWCKRVDIPLLCKTSRSRSLYVVRVLCVA